MARGFPKQFSLVAERIRAPVVREPILHKQIADTLRVEIAPPGRVSLAGVTWWSVDMAAYAGTVPGIRTGRGCIAGVPDIIVLYRGTAFFIEVKALDGVLSPAQQLVSAAILMGGAHYGVVRNASEALEQLDCWNIPRAHRIRGL
jgi:hypothetical protein